jgi:uncharacterized RDD family membrane protein YckC
MSLGYEALLLSAVLFVIALGYLFAEAALELSHSRIVFQAFLAGVAAAYFIWQWMHGQTLPMKTWRLRLVTRDGLPVSARRAALRFVVALCGLSAAGLTFAWALVDRDRQFLHDRIAGTRLVRTDAPLVSGGCEAAAR